VKRRVIESTRKNITISVKMEVYLAECATEDGLSEADIIRQALTIYSIVRKMAREDGTVHVKPDDTGAMMMVPVIPFKP